VPPRDGSDQEVHSNMTGYSKHLLRTILMALSLTAASSFVPMEFCSCGRGWGFPFAVVHPHKGYWLYIVLPTSGESTISLDFQYLAYNVIAWTCVVIVCRGAWALISRRRGS